MSEIELAIARFTDFINFCEETKQDVDLSTDKLALQALQEKAERDKMRCDNCNLKDHELCRAVWKTKYNIKKEKWTYKTMMEDDGFCNRFEPKEGNHG